MAAVLGPGSQFGPYVLGRLLGRGGFGEVYEATDTEKNRSVALKLLAAPYSGDLAFRQRLFREASNAGRLSEPHVVPVHSYGEIDGHLYIDMRLVDGEDLATLLERQSALEPSRAVWIVRQIASALDAAHAAGMVHRDVKPANILVSADDFACLVDFGLANAAADTKLTGTGMTIGTFAYLAPERFIDAGSADHRADVYALACVLFECLTGGQPYAGSTDLPALMGAHLNAPIPRPSQTRPGLPAAFDEVVALGLAKDAASRYQSAGELAAAAHQALAAAPGRATGDLDSASNPTVLPTPRVDQTPASLGRPRGLRWAWVAAGIAVVLLTAVTVGLVALRNPHPGPGPSSAAPSSTSESAPRPTVPGQTVLPLTNLEGAGSLAVDADGNVFVVARSQKSHVVVELRAGSNEQIELPMDVDPYYLAVDSAGAVYVSQFSGVSKLAAGATMQSELPALPEDVHGGPLAVDAGGAVYLTGENGPVLKLSPGATEWTVLPITGVRYSRGIAVDAVGNVYVSSEVNNTVVKLPAGSDQQVQLPFTGLSGAQGVAAGGDGSVYVADVMNNRVLKLAPGSDQPTALHFEGMYQPGHVAVDLAGNVYLSSLSNEVLKLEPQ